MKETPILYSTDMIRAYLLGKKTVTRRVITPQPERGVICKCPGDDKSFANFEMYLDARKTGWIPIGKTFLCPYGKVDDALWVRETWAIGSHSIDYPNRLEVLYKTTHDDNNDRQWVKVPFDIWVKYSHKNKWQSGRFMPHFASRLTQPITGIRIERLHDITEADADAEGIEVWFQSLGNKAWDNIQREGAKYAKLRDLHASFVSSVDYYAVLWDKINGKTHPWGNNEWVWVINYPAYKETR